MKALLLCVLVALVPACPNTPGPLPPPLPDASDAAPPPPPTPEADAEPARDGALTPEAGPPPSSACSLACAALQAAGCPLGARPDCAAFLTSDLGTGKVPNAATGNALRCADLQVVKTAADATRLGLACR